MSPTPTPTPIQLDLRRDLPKVREALLAVVDAIRDYLPPDGISKDECLNRVIGAIDNPEINPVIRELENGRS